MGTRSGGELQCKLWKAVSSGLLCAGLAFLACFESVLLGICSVPGFMLGHSRDPDAPHIESCALAASRLVAEAGVETNRSPMRPKLVSPFADG